MKHLFLLCGEGGGSSLLKYVLVKCKNIVSFEQEGDRAWDTYGPSSWTCENYKKPAQLLLPIFEDNKNYQWGRIKLRWNNLWKKQDDDRIYMQKGTGDYARWKLLANEFENVHFIIMPRNPFAHIEGMMRKCNWNISCYDMAQGWVNMLYKQWECYTEYDRNKTTFFTFEQLCMGDMNVQYKIQDLIPGELDDVSIECEFQHQHNRRDFASPPYHGIGFNVGSINRLGLKDIYTIKKVLYPHRALLERIGYWYENSSAGDA